MKILLINKKTIIPVLFIGCFFLICVITFFFLKSKYPVSQNVIYSVTPSKNQNYDLTGDGSKDSFQLLSNENKLDFNIKSSGEEFYLSKEIDDKILFTKSIHWTPRIFMHDLSRDNIPEIIMTGCKNNKSIYYIFSWDSNNFNLVSSGNNNILGILNCKNSKTPQCFSLSSSSAGTSLDSFMIINHEQLNTKCSNFTIPSLDTVLKFINLIELSYDLDELPDIFTTDINKEELSICWTLNKNDYSYSFQNGFFYDYEWNDYNEPITLKWLLSFEKSKLAGKDSDKEELNIFLNVTKKDSLFKISDIQKSK